jgi:hypothetical protein
VRQGDLVIDSRRQTHPARLARAGTDPGPPGAFSWANAQASQSSPGLKKASRGRPEHLLEAACKVVHASYGGVAFVSPAGEPVENLIWGLPDALADELTRSSWLADLIRAVLRQAEPTRLTDLAWVEGAKQPPAGLAPHGPLLAVPLTRPGRLRGALYLVRGPGRPPFTQEDEEKLLPLTACLEQGSLFEEAHLQAQLRLLNRVAQAAAAGNLDLAHILEVALSELARGMAM